MREAEKYLQTERERGSVCGVDVMREVETLRERERERERERKRERNVG